MSLNVSRNQRAAILVDNSNLFKTALGLGVISDGYEGVFWPSGWLCREGENGPGTPIRVGLRGQGGHCEGSTPTSQDEAADAFILKDRIYRG